MPHTTRASGEFQVCEVVPVFVLVFALFAQILNPLVSVPAYMLADPITTERLTLTTLEGRFAVTPMQGCDWLAPYQQINVYPNWAIPPWLGLSGTDSVQPGCVVRVEGRMDATPCFTNDAGECDVAGELE